MIETAILGLLTEGPSHGYGIHRRLVDMGFWRISFGSVYPALRRLEASEAIEVVDTDDKGRKLHRLTDNGRQILMEKLTDPETIDNSSAFRIRLTFLELLSLGQRIEVLTRRRDVLRGRIEAMREIAESPQRTQYAQIEMEHRLMTTQYDVDWLDSLIEKEGTI